MGGMKRRILSAVGVLAAVLTMTAVAGSPAQAAGTRCSNIVTVTPGVVGQVCVAAAQNNQTRAEAVVRNYNNYRVPVEIALYLNYGGSNHLYAAAGTGNGQGLAPNNAILCTQPWTTWTPPGRFALAEVWVNGVYRVISSPAVY
jgi:hypothetical protein